jgi:hypothetical protein
MNNITLQVTDISKNGSHHVKLVVDDKESGIIYLTNSQFEPFVDVLHAGCREKNISFNIENPFDVERENNEDFADEDY